MKKRLFKLYLMLWGLCIIFLFVIISAYESFSHITWIHIPFHSAIETIGAIAAIVTSLVLIKRFQQEQLDIFFMVATGMICMGILDLFHAMCMPGEAFIFLHSIASLMGGIFFLMAWLPKPVNKEYMGEQQWILWAAIIVCVSIGLRAIFFPEYVPQIIKLFDGSFTLPAITINMIAGILFLISTPKYYFLAKSTQRQIFFIFMCLSFLFGIAELSFPYSNLWNIVWWIWHIFRLLGNVVLLWYLLNHSFCDI